MAVTMEQVLAQLDREEPDYKRAARLGPEALPHLLRLIEEGDPGLASKATYLAGFIDAEQSGAAVEAAARSAHAVVRVAAAGSLRYLKEISSSLVIDLLKDQNTGVRRLALKSLETHQPEGLKARVQELARNDPDQAVRQQANRVVDRVR